MNGIVVETIYNANRIPLASIEKKWQDLTNVRGGMNALPVVNHLITNKSYVVVTHRELIGVALLVMMMTIQMIQVDRIGL